MSFQVLEADKFRADLEEAAYWLYLHNLEQSQEFADRKFQDLQDEIDNLKTHLKKTPYMGQADEISGIRRFPIYEGRFSATWTIVEKTRTVTLLEFLDSKHPQNLRQLKFDESD